jgi:hypothetical protein
VCGDRRNAATTANDEARTSSLDASGSEGSFNNKRVAFIALTFGDASQGGSGIQEVKFVGTTATINFERSLAKSTATLVQVLGGDYAASGSSAIGSNENVIVKLHPRCSHFIAEIPAHETLIESVSLDSTSIRGIAVREAKRLAGATSSREPQIHGSAPPRNGLTCSPEDKTWRTLSLEVPFTPVGEEKRLTVDVRVPDSSYGTKWQTTTNEARWTESLPPSPLKLGVRSIQFRWRRPVGCLAERWSEPIPKLKDTPWNQSCPRATLSNSTVCSVISPEPRDNSSEQEACEYRCEIKATLDALTLPISVTFDRIRTNPTTRQPEVVYSWHDQIEYSGQELTSVVAPNDRRVMLEFQNPSDWKDRYGDKLDAIRIVSGQSSNQLDLMGRDDDEVLPRWVSLPTAGRTCTDRVRVAVVGTRRYDEKTFEAKNGRVELTRPYDYRPHLLFYGLAGSGALFRHLTSNVRSATLGELGLGGQYDLGGPWSLDAEVTGQFTHTFYEGIELSDRQKSDFLTVSYLRFDVRGALEWWHHRRFGVAMSVGLGLGTPLGFADARIVGAVRFSTLVEAQPLIFTMFPRRLWFLAGTGFRLLEQHMDYVTDFTGSPTPNLERDPQWYVFLRFRGALE